jgi:hypothetical protein
MEVVQEHRFNVLDISCTFLCTEELSIVCRIFHFTALFWRFSIIIYILKTRAASKPLHFGGIRKADNSNSWKTMGFGNNLSMPFEFVHNSTVILLLEFLLPMCRSSQNASVLKCCFSKWLCEGSGPLAEQLSIHWYVLDHILKKLIYLCWKCGMHTINFTDN